MDQMLHAVRLTKPKLRCDACVAMGLVSIGSSLGGIIFPIMISRLLPRVGFGWTMRICAFLILALLLFANLTVCSRIPPSKRPYEMMSFVRPYREPAFLMLTSAMFFFYCRLHHHRLTWHDTDLLPTGGMFVPLTYIVVEAESHGMSNRLANYLVPILNAASILGRTIPNIISDKVGRFNVMSVMSAFTTIVILALWLPATGDAPLIVFAVLFGIGSGAGIGLAPALVSQISPIQDIGIRTGSAVAISSIAALTGSPIGGRILSDGSGDFRYTAVFAGVTCAVGTLLFVATRIVLAGLKPKVV